MQGHLDTEENESFKRSVNTRFRKTKKYTSINNSINNSYANSIGKQQTKAKSTSKSVSQNMMNLSLAFT